MAHRLTEIRLALVALFIGNTAAGDNVYGNRARRFFEGKLPAIHVSTLGRDTGVVSDTPSYRQSAEFAIAIVVRDDAAADDSAEALLDEVERLILRNPTLNGLSAMPLQPKRLQIAFDGDGERVVAVYAQTYVAEWHEDPYLEETVTEPATAPKLGDLNHLHVDIDAPPFDSPAEHERWLAADYSGSRPDAQDDLSPTG